MPDIINTEKPLFSHLLNTELWSVCQCRPIFSRKSDKFDPLIELKGADLLVKGTYIYNKQNVKWWLDQMARDQVASTASTTENQHPTIQLVAFVHLLILLNPPYESIGCYFHKANSYKPIVHYLPSAKQHQKWKWVTGEDNWISSKPKKDRYFSQEFVGSN